MRKKVLGNNECLVRQTHLLLAISAIVVIKSKKAQGCCLNDLIPSQHRTLFGDIDHGRRRAIVSHRQTGWQILVLCTLGDLTVRLSLMQLNSNKRQRGYSRRPTALCSQLDLDAAIF